MANNKIYSQNKWKQITAPLEKIDPILSHFISEKGLPILHNTRSWPNREIRWLYQIERLIEIYLEDDEKTWTLWVCAYNYQNSKRLRKSKVILKSISIEEMEDKLWDKLNEAYDLVCSWDNDALTEVD